MDRPKQNMKDYLIALLRKIAYLLEGRNWQKEYLARKDIVGNVIHKCAKEILDYNIPEELRTTAACPIIEGPSFNYFSFKDGGIPRFDYVIPDVPLYIVIGTPLNSSKDTALNHGFSLEQWASEREKLEIIQTAIPKLEQTSFAVQAQFLFFDCDHPITPDLVYIELVKIITNPPK